MGSSGSSGIVTLLSDFGAKDAYVGVMKGVILGLWPEARIVDLTHEIAPQNIREARFQLEGALPYFPAGTIHVNVVDPGVGSSRRILCARTRDRWLLAPDNGLLTGLLGQGAEVRAVTNKAWFLAGAISRTFHGRDIFAPVAARLGRGEPFESVGAVVSDPQLLELEVARRCADGALVGRIEHIDTFGNLITNVRTSDLGGAVPRSIDFLGHALPGLSESYATVGQGQPLAIIDSFDHLEIAVRGGSAAAHFNAVVGDEVRVRFSI